MRLAFGGIGRRLAGLRLVHSAPQAAPVAMSPFPRKLCIGALIGLGLGIAACDKAPDESNDVADVGGKSSPQRMGCVPPESIIATGQKVPIRSAAKTSVYLDSSQSMAGYLQGSTGDVRPLGDLLAILSQKYQSRAEYLSFGREIHPLPSSSDAERYGTTAPYNCKGSACDNQESRIDKVLQAVVKKGGSSLNVIVTDLWLDNRAFKGSSQVGLGLPLRELLKQGHAVGVLGVMAPFRGPIYDIPGGGTYREATERPLFIIMVGPEQDVMGLRDDISASNSPAFANSRLRFSLFSAAPRNVVVGANLQSSGGGVVRGAAVAPGSLSNVAQYRMQLGLASAQKGRLAAAFNGAKMLPDGFVWRGTFGQATRVWKLAAEGELQKCGPATWSEVGQLQNVWRPAEDGQAVFSLEPDQKGVLRPGNTYFVESTLVTTTLGAPNPQNTWMRDWSLSPGEASQFLATHPTQFKALNLSDLATVLEQELNSQLPRGRPNVTFGFVLKVDR